MAKMAQGSPQLSSQQKELDRGQVEMGVCESTESAMMTIGYIMYVLIEMCLGSSSEMFQKYLSILLYFIRPEYGLAVEILPIY